MMRIAATSLLPGRRKGPIFLTDLNVSSQNTAMNIGVKSGSQADAGRNRFTLTGRSVALDRRVNAIRGDLADVALAGRYFAPHYSCPQTFSLTAPRVAIRSKAHMSSRSEEHTSELQSLMRLSYAVFCLKKKNKNHHIISNSIK